MASELHEGTAGSQFDGLLDKYEIGRKGKWHQSLSGQNNKQKLIKK